VWLFLEKIHDGEGCVVSAESENALKRFGKLRKISWGVGLHPMGLATAYFRRFGGS